MCESREGERMRIGNPIEIFIYCLKHRIKEHERRLKDSPGDAYLQGRYDGYRLALETLEELL